MTRFVLLDAGPLGRATLARGKPVGDDCRSWLARVVSAGHEVVIPEVADYEVRRELVRLGASAGLKRLDALQSRFAYLPITTAAMIRAAELWAVVRGLGMPTAGPGDLDADAILAGQAATLGLLGDAVIVATGNLRHFGRFPGIDAREWNTIG